MSIRIENDNQPEQQSLNTRQKDSERKETANFHHSHQSIKNNDFDTSSGQDNNVYAMTSQDLRKKIKYLFQELQQSNAQNKKLENIISTNRETIQGALTLRDTTDRLTNQTQGTTQKASASQMLKQNSQMAGAKGSVNIIIEKLNTENKMLLSMIGDLKTERNAAQSKALVMEQICEMMQKDEKQNFYEMRRKVKICMKKLVEKDSQLDILKTELDRKSGKHAKLGPSISPIHLLDKQKSTEADVIPPSKAILKMQKEIDELNQASKRSLEEIMKLQREKQDILKINFVRTQISNSFQNF